MENRTITLLFIERFYSEILIFKKTGVLVKPKYKQRQINGVTAFKAGYLSTWQLCLRKLGETTAFLVNLLNKNISSKLSGFVHSLSQETNHLFQRLFCILY